MLVESGAVHFGVHTRGLVPLQPTEPSAWKATSRLGVLARSIEYTVPLSIWAPQPPCAAVCHSGFSCATLVVVSTFSAGLDAARDPSWPYCPHEHPAATGASAMPTNPSRILRVLLPMASPPGLPRFPGALGRTRTCAHGSGGRCSIR